MGLNEFASDVYSQYGEDGILGEVFRRLPRAGGGDRWCVEFGAWDGVHLSNTCRLIRDHGYHAVLIEGDRRRYSDLLRNMASDRVHPINAWVAVEGPCSLDSLLASTPLPTEFDLLSIDVDGIDIHLWRSLERYRPSVVCIEFNPTIPNRVRFEQPPDPQVQWGSSPRSIVDLADEKGYDLVACTAVNLVFTSKESTRFVLGELRPTLDELRDDDGVGLVLFAGYDGTVHGDHDLFRFPWQRLEVPASRVRSLPRPVRGYGAQSRRSVAVLLVGVRVLNRLRRLRWSQRKRRSWSGWSAGRR